MSDSYWRTYEQCLDEVAAAARTVDDLIGILNVHYAPSAGDAFFPGGADRTLLDALRQAGWRVVWMEAHYYYAARQPEGADGITFIEGDVERGISAPPHC